MDDRILVIVILALLASGYVIPKIMGLTARYKVNREDRAEGLMGRTLLGEATGRLPGDLDYIARIGADAIARDSAGTKVLRTTSGLRLISVGVALLFAAFLTSGALHGIVPAEYEPLVLLGMAVLVTGNVLNILTYELRVDRHGMVLTQYGFWRRSFEWVHLLGIDDDQNYQYVLAFARGGRVKVLKHLVGMPHFLTLVRETLARNKARDAGVARG